MSNFANNMPPHVTAGAYSGMGAPTWGMQANAEMPVNSWANNAPAHISPAYSGPMHTMGYAPMHHCHPVKPVVAAAAACGAGSSVGVILVLFILLVIISRVCFI